MAMAPRPPDRPPAGGPAPGRGGWDDPGRTLAADCADRVGRRVSLRGWLHAWHQDPPAHLVLRDRSGRVRVRATGGWPSDWAGDPVRETVLAVAGRVARDADEVVVLADHVETVARASRRPPALEPGPSALGNRHPRRLLLARMGAAVQAGFRSALDERGFVEVCTPRTAAMPVGTESAALPIEYPGRRGYLVEDSHPYLQVMVGALARVYEIGPAFAVPAAPSGGELMEWTALDLEQGFVAGVTDLVETALAVLRTMLDHVAARCGQECSRWGIRLPALPADAPTIEREAARPGDGELAALARTVRGRFGTDVFVLRPAPRDARHLSVAESEDGRPLDFALVCRGAVVATGEQHRHLLEDVRAAAERSGRDLAPQAAYLEAFEFGMPPHGGCRFGLERVLSAMTGDADLRLAALFPRDLEHLSP
jgi:nondiscriminating aspartyl-tRNA synthetase